MNSNEKMMKMRDIILKKEKPKPKKRQDQIFLIKSTKMPKKGKKQKK